ncbi:MAG: hypothetical protein ABSG14_01910 [Verrucomicrobiia bacterium]|jgi:hypothetical protein
MSTPEEIEGQPRSEHGQLTTNSLRTTSTVNVSMDVAGAIDQLRALVCGLGVGLLIVSLAFTALVFKQNRDLTAGKTTHERQIARLQANERSMDYLVDALVKYSAGKPDLMALLARHGLQVAPPPASAPPQH